MAPEFWCGLEAGLSHNQLTGESVSAAMKPESLHTGLFASLGKGLLYFQKPLPLPY